MSNRLNQRNTINAISIENTAIGEYLTGDDGDKFVKFPADAQPPTMVSRTSVPNQMIGSGNAYDQHSKPYYYDALNKPYSGALTNTIGARIIRMFLGGPITTVDNGNVVGTKDHTIEQLTPGSEPMVCNQIRAHKLGGPEFLFGDVYTQTLEISQQGSSQPRITASFSNGGHHAELPDTDIDKADILALANYLMFDGKKTRLTFSDGTTNYDFAADKRLIDVTFTGNQNVINEQLPGDGPIDPDNECEGGFTDNIHIDVQDAQIRVKCYLDSNFHTSEFAAWKSNKKLTSISLIFKTCEKIGSATHNAEIELKMPIGEFMMESDSQGNFDAVTYVIKGIEGDPVTGSLVKARIRMTGNLDVTI